MDTTRVVDESVHWCSNHRICRVLGRHTKTPGLRLATTPDGRRDPTVRGRGPHGRGTRGRGQKYRSSLHTGRGRREERNIPERTAVTRMRLPGPRRGKEVLEAK